MNIMVELQTIKIGSVAPYFTSMRRNSTAKQPHCLPLLNQTNKTTIYFSYCLVSIEPEASLATIFTRCSVGANRKKCKFYCRIYYLNGLYLLRFRLQLEKSKRIRVLEKQEKNRWDVTATKRKKKLRS